MFDVLDVQVEFFVLPPLIPSPVPLWQFLGGDNPRQYSIEHGVGTPDVLPLLSMSMEITREWQWYIRAMNPGMAPEQASALLGDQKAFTNNNGFGNPDEPRANWILGENLTAPLPKFPKVFTCGFACHTGREEGDELVVTTFNGNNPPPDINLINPGSHPWLFFHATVVKVSSTTEARYPFPNGQPTWGVNVPAVWMPLVSRFEVRYPLAKMRKVSGYVLPYV